MVLCRMEHVESFVTGEDRLPKYLGGGVTRSKTYSFRCGKSEGYGGAVCYHG
jgi:hypothetical protein